MSFEKSNGTNYTKGDDDSKKHIKEQEREATYLGRRQLTHVIIIPKAIKDKCTTSETCKLQSHYIK